MRFYTRQHHFYCGIDLHARTMYVCILDGAGNVLVHKDLAAGQTGWPTRALARAFPSCSDTPCT